MHVTAGVLDTPHEITGDVAVGASGAATIQAGAVSTSKLGGDITAAGKALLDDADAAAQRTTLGLGSAATQASSAFEAAGAVSTHVGLADPHTQYALESALATVASSGSASDLGTGTLPAARLASGSVALTKIEDFAQSTIAGRAAAAGTGAPVALTVAQVKTILAIAASDVSGLAAVATSGSAADLGAGTLPAARMPALTGDVTTSVGAVATTIAAGAVSLAKMANVATATILGRATAGSGAPEALTGTQATALLDAVSVSAKGLAPVAPNDTTKFLRGDASWAVPSTGSPSWAGKIAAAYGDGNPTRLLDLVSGQGAAPVDATPTNIGVTTARISYFTLPFDLVVNKVRFFGVGATSNVYRIAIYRFSTLARLSAETAFSTSANAWGSVYSGLNLTLSAGVLYFIACSVNATGTTAGVRCCAPTPGSSGPWRNVLPSAWPGSLAAGAGFGGISALGQFTVVAGALPDPAALIAVQGAWTGGMPAFWLDNSNA